MPLGSWQGPVASGYGNHLVFLSERTPGQLPPLEKVRAEVERDWLAEMRVKSNEAIYQSWLTQYSITFEDNPEPKGAPSK